MLWVPGSPRCEQMIGVAPRSKSSLMTGIIIATRMSTTSGWDVSLRSIFASTRRST